MSHTLQALIVPVAAARHLRQHPAPTHAVPISGSLLLVPLTDELYDFLAEGVSSDDEAYPDTFWKFHQAIKAFGSQVADGDLFAYIETDYFGGQGMQAAGAWRGSDTVVEPRSAAIGPINDVLRAMGVAASSRVDEFDAVGLSRHRHMEDWLDDPSIGDASVSAPPIRRVAQQRKRPWWRFWK